MFCICLGASGVLIDFGNYFSGDNFFFVGFVHFAVMGNVSGRKDEAGPSGITRSTADEEGEEYMEYAHGGPFPDSMVQSPPHSPRPYCSPFIFAPQVSFTYLVIIWT